MISEAKVCEPNIHGLSAGCPGLSAAKVTVEIKVRFVSQVFAITVVSLFCVAVTFIITQVSYDVRQIG